ncbi:hypothetical protein DEU56DRAFT_782391 [Suillus clintonianus]|uniref:uncharacterized protein n=1 Tax=Suillus clintonianus TaxID=1904413 RepID=UPI001B86CE1C|nr:uncharacterized protein DEU56DRAFT_782391 [Suillus clintonianus]KAG2148824.1 hypothetical protein DEU56DRAFT_782391 [Suillus clintonianus]
MLTVIPAFQPKRAGRLFVHTLSASFEPFAQRCFKGAIAIFRVPLNATLFVVIVFIQLALNAFGYFFKNNNGPKAKDRKNAKRSKRLSRTQIDMERLEADASLDEQHREGSLDEGSSQNISSSLELQMPAMSLASTCIAPLSREDSKMHLDSTTSARTRRVHRLVSHLKQHTDNDGPGHCHDKKIRKTNSEYRKSQTDGEALLQDSSRSGILRTSNQPLVRQVTHALSSVFRTPLRLPKNTATVACHTPDSVEGPIGDVMTFTYPPYPVSKVADSSERKWPWQIRETRGPCIEA